MNRKAIAAIICVLMGAGLMCGCGSGEKSESVGESSAVTTEKTADGGKTAEEAPAEDGGEDAEEDEAVSEYEGTITLNGASAEVTGEGVSVEGGTVTVTKAGNYAVTGELTDGSIVVAADSADKVELYLSGASISSQTSAPIRIENADSCVIHLEEGTVNTLTDTAANEFSAALSSKDDLTIKGKGSLTVTGNAKHAIKSSNDVRIKNGNITVSAVKTGIYGEDSVQVTGGYITVTGCTDGIKASNTEEADKGFVSIEEASVAVQAASGNGIEAVTGVTVTSGSVRIHSDKQAVNCDIQDITEGCLVVE